MGPRYVVARHCFGGIGDHLSCLAGAWWLAKRTGSTLVVDWRGSRFNPDASAQRNCFHVYFEPRPTLGGVEVIADDSVGGLDYPLPIWPEKWTRSTLAGPEHMKHTADEIVAVNRIVTSEEDPVARTIVLNQWVEPSPPREAVRVLLDELRPVESIRVEAQQFVEEQMGSSPSVAIHLRHGNGENVGARAAYWLGPVALVRQLAMNARTDMHRPGLSGRFADNMPLSLVGTPSQAGAERRFCRHVAAEFRALSQAAGLNDAVPMLFCDSEQIVEAMRQALPSLVVRPKRLLGKGEGPLHQFDLEAVRISAQGGVRSGTISDEITRDMFVELELMRRCEGLVYMDSGFSLFSRIKLDESRVVHLEPNLINRFITKVMARLTA